MKRACCREPGHPPSDITVVRPRAVVRGIWHVHCLIDTMISRRSPDNPGPPQPRTRKAGLAKRERGRTPISTTPVTMRSGVALSSAARSSIERQVKRVLAPFGTRIERGSIRFEDVNGPKGGMDSKCTIKVVLSGGPSLVVERCGVSLHEAASRAVRLLGTQIRRRTKSDGGRTPQPTIADPGPPKRPRRSSSGAQDDDSVTDTPIGRTAGNLAAALERPEKEQRDVYVDTAAPGVSETDRRAGGPFSARRNSRGESSGMAYALENSEADPSRKSTRASSNRSKAASQLARRVKRRTHSASARARRALAAAQ